jgi:Tfp pilus assembly protein PilN
MPKTPITFEQFSKDPVKGLLFIALLAVGGLYIDGRMNYQSQITKHEDKIMLLENKIDLLTTALKRSDSALAVTVTKLEILTQMQK